MLSHQEHRGIKQKDLLVLQKRFLSHISLRFTLKKILNPGRHRAKKDTQASFIPPQNKCALSKRAVLCLVAQSLWLFATPWTIACQTRLLSLGFPRQEYSSGLPFSPPGDLPIPGIERRSSVAGRFFAIWATSVAHKLKWDPYYLPMMLQNSMKKVKKE